MRPTTLFAALLLALQLASPALASHDDPKTYTRLYLLASDEEFLYWSVDPSDPELGHRRMERRCHLGRPSGVPGDEPCSFTFLPGSRLEDAVAWTGADPLRFHLAMDVISPAPYTVTLQAGGGGESAPATQAGPGVWEGTLGSGSPMSPGAWATFTLRINQEVVDNTATLRTDGSSWIDLPTPVRARAVPELTRRSPATTADAGTFTSPFRDFTFNDAAWQATAFQGDLQQARTFDVTLEDDTALVFAWVELFDRPLMHDILMGRSPDARKLTESPRTELLRNGELVARGHNSGVYGMGTDAVAALDVAAGPLTLRISPTAVFPTSFHHGHPFRAYVLEVKGERTLRSMRWLSMFGDYPGLGPMNSAFVARCPSTPPEIVPVTDQVTSFHVDMDADSAVPTASWTLAFEVGNTIFPCGELGNGDALRFTFGTEGIKRVGATIADDATYSEWRSTVFEWEARFAYTPRPEDLEHPQP